MWFLSFAIEPKRVADLGRFWMCWVSCSIWNWLVRVGVVGIIRKKANLQSKGARCSGYLCIEGWRQRTNAVLRAAQIFSVLWRPRTSCYIHFLDCIFCFDWVLILGSDLWPEQSCLFFSTDLGFWIVWDWISLARTAAISLWSTSFVFLFAFSNRQLLIYRDK